MLRALVVVLSHASDGRGYQAMHWSNSQARVGRERRFGVGWFRRQPPHSGGLQAGCDPCSLS